ncbi:T9SS type A sorting domain-containing protein [bacterium]|nr:T9SS type A sorting domain-containing protein [bacterium]
MNNLSSFAERLEERYICRTVLQKLLTVFTFLVLITGIAFAWERYDGNPVMSPGELWCWGALTDPDMIALPDGGFYAVYSAAGVDSGSSVTLTRPGAAWSDDGFSWIMSEGPVIYNGAPGTWDSAAVETPAILHEGDSIIMVYAGDWAHGSGDLALGLAVSYDGGYSYSRRHDGPVFEKDTTLPEEWHSIESPSVLRLGDSLVMWYSALSITGHVNICRAASIDGINWFRHPANPVMEHGPLNSYDELGAYAATVRQKGDTLYMLYQGWLFDDSTYWNFDTAYLCLATSIDRGVIWEKYSGNPVMGPGGPEAWDPHGPVTPTFAFDGDQMIIMVWNGGGVSGSGSLGIITHELTTIGNYNSNTTPENCELLIHPNPFNAGCQIKSSKYAQLEIFDMQGHSVLAVKTGNSGEFYWQPGKEHGSGIYLVKTSRGKQSKHRPIIYLK